MLALVAVVLFGILGARKSSQANRLQREALDLENQAVISVTHVTVESITSTEMKLHYDIKNHGRSPVTVNEDQSVLAAFVDIGGEMKIASANENSILRSTVESTLGPGECVSVSGVIDVDGYPGDLPRDAEEDDFAFLIGVRILYGTDSTGARSRTPIACFASTPGTRAFHPCDLGERESFGRAFVLERFARRDKLRLARDR